MKTYNAATGRHEYLMISSSDEAQMGERIHQDILGQYKISTDQAKNARLTRIGQSLVLVSDRQDVVYQFYLIESEDLNAFTVPGGSVYFFTGLFDQLATDDQIAFVLAHELGHTAARHAVKKFQAAVGYNVLANVVFNAVDMSDTAKAVLGLTSSQIMNIVFSSYSRKDEYESDRLGVKYMYLAGYDLKGAIGALEVLEQESKGPKTPLFLRTHPFISDRVLAVKKEIDKVQVEFGFRS